jgi:hypothetical protein
VFSGGNVNLDQLKGLRVELNAGPNQLRRVACQSHV